MKHEEHWLEERCDICDRPLPAPYGALCPRCIDAMDDEDVA